MGFGRRRACGAVILGCVLALGAASAAAAQSNTLRVYPVPRGLLYSAHNDDYTVRVRPPGGKWQDLYEYHIRGDTDTLQNASLVYFDFSGSVEVEVEKNNGHFSSVAMAIFSGDSTLIRNITFSNVRVERIEEGKLINIVAGNNARYNTKPGRGIDGVMFKNITYTGNGMPGVSIVRGLSDATAVKHVTIENLRIGKRKVLTPPDADIDVGPFVMGLRIH